MPNPVALDFRRPPYLSRRQLQTVRQAHEDFAKSLSANLSAYFRIGVETTINSVELMAYSDFAEKVGPSACWAGLWLPAEAARAVMQMEASLVYPLLELILGGDSRSAEQTERELTEIERSLLESVIRIILKEWKESWKRIAPLEFLVESVQSEASIVDLLPAGETVVAIGVEFRISDSTGRMSLAIPALTVKNLKQRSETNQIATVPVTSPEMQADLWELVRTSPVTVEAQIAGPTIKFRDLLGLTVGQVLMVDHPLERGIAGTANRSRCFEGRLARKGTKRALLIEKLAVGNNNRSI